jgi:hypothetical protein
MKTPKGAVFKGHDVDFGDCIHQEFEELALEGSLFLVGGQFFPVVLFLLLFPDGLIARKLFLGLHIRLHYWWR